MEKSGDVVCSWNQAKENGNRMFYPRSFKVDVSSCLTFFVQPLDVVYGNTWPEPARNNLLIPVSWEHRGTGNGGSRVSAGTEATSRVCWH